jgi:hypothetical protein
MNLIRTALIFGMVGAFTLPSAAGGAPTKKPDLRVWGVLDPPSVLPIGQEFSEDISIRNVGRNKTAKKGRTEIYLTRDPQNPTREVYLGRVVLPRLQRGHTSIKSVRLKLPATTPIWPEYFVLACTDTTHVVRESDEGNNCSTSAIGMNVTAPLGNAPG